MTGNLFSYQIEYLVSGLIKGLNNIFFKAEVFYAVPKFCDFCGYCAIYCS